MPRRILQGSAIITHYDELEYRMFKVLEDVGVESAIEYARKHPSDFLAQLREFLRIPSISTRPEHDGDVRQAAEWLAQNMREAGLENVKLFPTMGHPIVYGDWLHAPDAPTVLFYGHYDVQPADDLELWNSPPFEPDIRKESIYARGASDDKGQVLLLVKAVESFLRGNEQLPVNVKFMIEGEEEVGSTNISKFLPEKQELLAADVAFVADTAFADFNKPAIVYGLRGVAAINIDVVGPRLDLHSGSYGGAINNPINALSHILSKLKDENGTVQIPGFYDNLLPLTERERELLAENKIDQESWLKWTGSPALWGEQEYTLQERLGARPTLDINGIIGGYTGAGTKTIIPSKAHAKITMRLVPRQQPARIIENFIAYVQSIAPESVKVSFSGIQTAPPSINDLDHPAMQAAVEACESIYGQPPLFKREGGSIPIVGQIQRDLGVEAVMLGFSLPHDRIHSPNERFHLPNFYNGIETVIHFLANYAELG